MRIGIELVQIHPQQTGGCLQLVQGVLPHLFRLGAEDQFFLYCAPHGWQPKGPLPANATAKVLDLGGYWYHAVGTAAAADRIDVLFRSYPADAPPTFPPQRMVVLVPDLQHEMLPECFSEEILAKRRAAFVPAITQAGAVAVLAEHGRRLLEERYPQRYGEVFLLPPAAPFDESILHTPLDPADEERIPRQPYFLFPANLWPHKNHRRVIEAFGRFREGRPEDVALVLTGDPTPWPELRECCGDLPVHHLGYVRPRLLAELYRRAVALVYFTLYEGFGIPLLEAFHAGTPVLCGNTTSLPEVGGDAVLSCDPTNIAAIADLMHRIADSPGLRNELVAAGRRRRDVYRWESSAQGLLDAFHRVAARPAEHHGALAALESVYHTYAHQNYVIDKQDFEIKTLREHLAARAAECEERLRHLNDTAAELRRIEAECAARLDVINRQADLLEKRGDVITQLGSTIRSQSEALERANAPLLTKVRRRIGGKV